MSGLTERNITKQALIFALAEVSPCSQDEANASIERGHICPYIYVTIPGSDMPVKPRILIRMLERAKVQPRVRVISSKSGSGHRTAIRGRRRAHVPVHGGGYEIPDPLMRKILRDLGLSREDLN